LTFGIEDSDRYHNALLIGAAIVAAACLSKLKDTPATRYTASESIAVAEFMLKGGQGPSPRPGWRAKRRAMSQNLAARLEVIERRITWCAHKRVILDSHLTEL
jgi:hypothetical protein